MFITALHLKNFRNLNDANMHFSKNTTVLKGDNAQGKTNFLESIFLLATGKPIKAQSDEEVLNFGESAVSVVGDIENNSGKTQIATNIQKIGDVLRKKFLVNGISRRLLDYTGNLVVVYFRPEDIDLVTGSPTLRREFINQALSQVDRDYRKDINSYQKIIIQKNKLLKLIREGSANIDELIFWNEEQLKIGIKIQEKRKFFFEDVNSYEKKFGEFEYVYMQNEITLKRLEQYKEREIPAAVSLIGPHRDDFSFFEKGKDLSKYGSRGEQRTAVLDLKITELIFLEKVLGERPVLLLDDIFSELDLSHRAHVLDLSKLQQTIIATVEYDEYLKEELKDAEIFTVNNGVINF